MQRQVDGFIPQSENLRKSQPDKPDQQAAERRLDGLGQFDLVIEDPVERIHQADEAHRAHAAKQPQTDVGDHLDGMRHFIGDHLKSGEIAHHAARDNRGHDRTGHYGSQLNESEIAEDDLHREQGPRDRCIERGGDAPRGSTRHEQAHQTRRDVHEKTGDRTQRRSDLDDGSFPSHRAARSDAHGRREDFYQRHARPDEAAPLDHRRHHLGHAMSLGLPCEPINDGADDQPAKSRHQHHRRPSISAPTLRQTVKIVESLAQGFDEPRHADGSESGYDSDDHPASQDEHPLVGHQKPQCVLGLC